MNIKFFLNQLKNSNIQLQGIGGQLKITAPKGALTKEQLNILRENREQIIQTLQKIDKKHIYTSIQPVEKKEYYALSSAQKRLYFLQQIDLQSTAYNIPMALPLGKEIDKARLESTLKKLIIRHESFRTSLIMVNENPVQQVHDNVEFEIEYYDLQVESESDRRRWEEVPSRQVLDAFASHNLKGRELKAKSYIKNFIRPFDLSRAPLLRSGLIKIPDGNHAWLVDMHHIISDGTTGMILTEDFMSLYSEDGEELEPLRLQYKDFSYWQNGLLARGEIETQEKYWLELYADAAAVPRLDLPTDFKRPEIFTFAGDRYSFMLGREDAVKLKALGLENNGTLYMNILAALNTLFYKYTGQVDIIIGSGIAGRPHADLQHIVGMFVNTLAMRNYPEGEKTYESFLKEVIANSVRAFENQDVQFEELVERLEVERDPSRNPLFDILMLTQNLSQTKPGDAASRRTNSNSRQVSQADPVGITGLAEQLSLPEENLPEIKFDSLTTKFDMTFFVHESGEDVHFSIEYYTSIFKRQTIETLVRHFKNVIRQVLSNPEIKLIDINIVSEEEKEKILYRFNDTATDYPYHKTIGELFEQQVSIAPDRIALVGEDLLTMGYGHLCLSYKELNQRANQLALYLLHENRVVSEERIGVLMDRSLSLIVTLMGILKAGAAYVPLSPSFPEERLKHIIDDSGIRTVMSQARYIKTLNRLQRECQGMESFLCLDSKDVHGEEEKEANELTSRKLWEYVGETAVDEITGGDWKSTGSANLAYVIYTSGSTGQPKGSLTTHYNVTRVVKETNYIDIRRQDRVLQLSDYAFDGSVFDIFGALLNGAALVMMKKEDIPAMDILSHLLEKEMISVFFVTTALFNMVVNTGLTSLARVRKILFGGERVSVEHTAKALDFMGPDRILHVYGPTETTVYATYFPVNQIHRRQVTIPIGFPIANTTVYILDSRLRLAAAGISGELYIGGTGVSRGYLNQPELTAEKFRRAVISHSSLVISGSMQSCNHASMQYHSHSPHSTHSTYSTYSTIYRTGDLARWLWDSGIEFLGRIDDQVKIRGFRIELGEIESRLLRHDFIKEAVVIDKNNVEGSKYLAAYIVLEKEIESSELKEMLAQNLPDYMIPTYFTTIDRVPLTANGKLDRGALPEPRLEYTEGYQAPRDNLEKKLVEIWSEVLGITKEIIGIKSNFFQLGGHSLKATLLTSKIHKKINVKLPLAEVFRGPTIREQALYIKKAAKDKYASLEAVEKREYYALSSPQKRFYILQQLELSPTVYNLQRTFPLTGEVDIERLKQTFIQLIQRHESLRTSYLLVDKKTVQKVHQHTEIEFNIQSYEIDEEQAEKTMENFVKPFDLSKAPLLRVCLLRVRPSTQILLIDIHHITIDGTAEDILKKEFMTLYSAKEQSPLAPLRLQYKDFAEWQNSEKQRKLLKQQELFWLKAFSGELPVLNLPTDYPRPIMQNFEGNQTFFSLNEMETRALKEMVNKTNATLYIAILSVFTILLSKLSSQEDIIVGTVIAARRHADLENIIGMIANTLTMRNFPTGEKRFKEFLMEVKLRVLEVFENQEYQFEDLVEKISPRRDTSRNPIFDVMFNLGNQSDDTGPILGIDDLFEQDGFQHRKDKARFDLTLLVKDRGNQVVFLLEYSVRLFKKTTIERFIRYFKQIIATIVSDWQVKISDIELMGEEEKRTLLQMCCGEKEPVDTRTTIHGLFEKKSHEIPDNVAVVFKDKNISYANLNAKANQLARMLREKGVTRDRAVALMLERSCEMIIALLAIMKTGGAYLPIDTKYPDKRVYSMLDDGETPLLLTTDNKMQSFKFSNLMRSKADRLNPVVTAPREPICDFNKIAFPDRTLVDYDRYHKYIGNAMAKHTISLQTTRGCPFKCTYCHKIWSKKHIVRSAENIFSEMMNCYEAGARRFVFIDDIFNLDIRNSSKLFQKIIDRRLKVQLFFPNGLRGDLLTEEYIDLMVEAGTVNVALALETASPRLQKLTKKYLNLDKLQQRTEYFCRKYPQVILELFTMHGFPTETREEALMTMDFIKACKWIHFPAIQVLKIYPNSDMYQLAVANGVSEAAINASVDLAYHDIPETLPFSKAFTREYQARIMDEYILSRERLLHVLPYQMKSLTEDELVQKYDSYLPMSINSFSDILRLTDISQKELGGTVLLPANYMAAPGFSQKMRTYFPSQSKEKDKNENPLRILYLDLSQLFTAESTGMLYDMVEPPLGLMYLQTHIKNNFGNRVLGKIYKSRIDFENYEELKELIFSFNPDLIAVRTLSFFKDFFHRTISIIKQWGINVPVITGGPYATSDYSLILWDSHVDVVVLGEGELTFGQLVESILENNKKLPADSVLENIPGIAFVRSEDKAKLKTVNRDIIFIDKIGERLQRYPADNLDTINSGNDLVYIIYTSGSTGKPKGVMLEHRNVVNLLNHQFKNTNLDCSRILQFATIGFDASLHEIFSALLSGGILYLVESDTRGDVAELFAVIDRNGIKTLFLPMSFLNLIFNQEEYINLIPSCIEHIQTAGEQVIISTAFRDYLRKNHVYLHNHYGPTETHVVTTLTLEPRGEIPDRPSIGKPILNTGIYILDKGNHLVPQGVVGELYIGGEQVGRGYLDRPDLTAERFIELKVEVEEDIYHKSYRSYTSYIIYKTGDLARWLADGDIEFLGRIDHQVKIRGFRVELGEVEVQLLNHPQVKEAVVLARSDAPDRSLINYGNNYLCAYIIANSNIEFEISELRQYLSKCLPDYMLPSHLIQIDKIPLMPNGKINRKALPAPEIKAGEGFIAPRSAVEKKLVELWSDVLALDKDVIGIDSNFFELGGHSLRATILTSKIHKELDVKLPLAEVFKNPNIRGQALYIKKAAKDKYASLEPVEKREYYALSSAQKRLYFLQQLDLQSTAYNMPQSLPLGKDIYKDKLELTIRQLIARHESLRTSIEIVDEIPIQKVHDEPEFKIEYYDMKEVEVEVKVEKERSSIEGTRGLAPLSKNPAAAFSNPQPAAALISSFIRPFDLSQAPLLRSGLIKLPEGNYIWMVDMHHIISDGVSDNILRKDFIALSRGEKLPELRLQYKDFAGWQNSQEVKNTIKSQESYWLRQFEEGIPTLNIPIDFPRPARQSFEGNIVSFTINPEQTAALKLMASKQGATTFMTLLAILYILLFKLSRQEDIVIGVVVAGRGHADLEKIIGMFVNTLALRNFPARKQTFREFLKEVKQRTLEAFENQDYQYEMLVEQVAVNRDTNRNPLFDVAFGFMDTDAHTAKIAAAPRQTVTAPEPEAYTHENMMVKFDLALNGTTIDNSLFLFFEYRTKLYKKETIQHLSSHFIEIVRSMIKNPDTPLGEIELIGEEQSKELLQALQKEKPGEMQTIEEIPQKPSSSAQADFDF